MADEAMVLSPEEWEAAGRVAKHYLMATGWVNNDAQRCFAEASSPEHMEKLTACRDVCERIVAAT